MGKPARRPGGGLSRRERESRAYKLVLATGAGGLATVVTFVLAVFGAVSFGLVFVLAVFTALAWLGFRRTTAG